MSSGGIADAMQSSLFMPLLTRLPKQRVKSQVISLAPGCVRAAVLRQNGVPVHDVSLSRRKFSAGGYSALVKAVHEFRPDVIQAWGHTAQIASAWARKRCNWKPKLIWSIADTTPLSKQAGLIDRQKLKYAAKASNGVDRIVYTSEAGAAHHRRVGFPDGGHENIAPGADAARFKPDSAARIKIREKLEVPHEAFVIGMVAPFQPEYDHATLLKAVGELIKTNPNIYVLLAGHGVQRGNAPLMAMVGGGTLGTRTQLLGEWSDLASLFNACDLVCSSALNDSARITLATAMLCGVPCVATGMGAQGELIGQHGVAVEPGSPAAFIRGISKVLQMPQDKRLQMAQGARKHALQNFVYVRSLQKYLELYGNLVGREALATNAIVTPKAVEAPVVAAPVPPPPVAKKDHTAVIAELSDPDSLESKVAPAKTEELPKWRVEQEQARAEQDNRRSESTSSSDGDVLEIFARQIAKPSNASVTPMSERARGVADELEELLPLEALTGVVPAPAPASTPTPATKTAAEPSPAVVAPPAPQPEPLPVDTTSSALDVVTQPDELAAKSSAENTWTGEQVVLALEEPTALDAPQVSPAVEPEPKQESLFDFELMPDPPSKAVHG